MSHLDYTEYLARQSALIGPRCALLDAAARAVAAGLAPEDWSTELAHEDWRFAPAFLPVFHVRSSLVYGAWISDPIAGTLDAILVLRSMPKPTAAPLGRTGLRALVKMLSEVASSEIDDEPDRDGSTRALVDLVFADADEDARDALVSAALSGIDPRADDEVRALPIVRDLWTEADGAPEAAYADPLPAMFARNHVPVTPADHVPSPSRRPAFDDAMRAGDHRRAWSELNDTGWTYDECVKAFEELAPHLDTEIAELVRVKLDREIFGPTSGY